jgi:uncharacterized protein involved in exopolysaccharide biosynthesis
MPTQQQLLIFVEFVRRATLRHWKKGALVGAAGCLVALVGTLLLPRTYYSEARLFVRFGRENQVDPTATGGQMVALYESRESEINSLIEILRSRAIFDRVVTELTPEYILYGKGSGVRPLPAEAVPSEANPAAHASRSPESASNSPARATRAHQQAIRALEKSVMVSAPRRSNIITVATKARSPEIAQQIVARLVAVYLEEHVRVHRAAGSFEFFTEQGRVSKAAWQQAADRLAAAKNRQNIVTIDGKRRELETQLGDIAARLLSNQSDLKTSEGKIAALKRLMATLPATIVTQEVASPSTAFDLLEAQQQELAAKMTDDHPKLAALRQQVADLRTILAAQPSERKQATEALHPARQSLELALLTEQSQADSLRARERALVQQQQELRGALAALNASAIEIEQLQQQVALAEANHRDYAQRLEQARINRSLDDERISSLSLVQPASYVPQAAGPRRAYVLVGGMLLAAGSALGTILLAAWLNPVVTTAEQLAQVLDLPLLGTIPPLDLRAA